MKEPIITQFEPYLGMRPELVNVLNRKEFHVHDLLAGLLYLASKGIIEIDPQNTNKPFRVIESVVSAARLTPVQKLLISYTFTGKANDLPPLHPDKKDYLTATLVACNKEAVKELKNMGLLNHNPLLKDIRVPLVIGVIFFGAALIYEILFAVVLLFSPFLIIIGYTFSLVPTKAGKAAIAHMKGYEQYIETVEKDRSRYDAFADTNHLHEAIAYAVAFKHDASWSKEFKDYNTFLRN